MSIHFYNGNRWQLAGTYPDTAAPATMVHINAASEAMAKSLLDDGYRVRIDGIEVLPPTQAHMTAVAEQFEVATLATARESARRSTGERKVAA